MSGKPHMFRTVARLTLAIGVTTVCRIASAQIPFDELPPVSSTAPRSSVVATGATPKVNIVYLVPSDRTVQQQYVSALDNAINSLRTWYADQLPQSKTFRIATPVVHVVPLPHTAAWYADNPRPAVFMQFWDNVLADAFPLTGGGFNDRENVWAYYIDADPACGQCGGCGINGVVVIAANDLRGFFGEPWRPACPGDFDSGGPGRFIGGLGHELGHAFGLPHPPGCDQGSAQCDYNALMWNGFRVYPNTYLRADEIPVLNNSPFFLLPPSPKRRAARH